MCVCVIVHGVWVDGLVANRHAGQHELQPCSSAKSRCSESMCWESDARRCDANAPSRASTTLLRAEKEAHHERLPCPHPSPFEDQWECRYGVDGCNDMSRARDSGKVSNNILTLDRQFLDPFLSLSGTGVEHCPCRTTGIAGHCRKEGKRHTTSPIAERETEKRKRRAIRYYQ